MGAPVTSAAFTRICLALEAAGAENINIVTGSHQAPLLAAYLRAAKQGGLRLPVCWNSSGYETPAALEPLAGLVDLWLPDLKTVSRDTARRLYGAPDYPDVAKAALAWCIAHGPTIVRHLALPGRLDDTIAVLDHLSRHARRATVSLMTQYSPIPGHTGSSPVPPGKDSLDCRPTSFATRNIAESGPIASPTRPINADEHRELVSLLAAYRFDAPYYQELRPNDADWLPDFARPQPFPNARATTIWHWASSV
jgi:putative pyruvate formate lyase activating enzyme